MPLEDSITTPTPTKFGFKNYQSLTFTKWVKLNLFLYDYTLPLYWQPLAILIGMQTTTMS